MTLNCQGGKNGHETVEKKKHSRTGVEHAGSSIMVNMRRKGEEEKDLIIRPFFA